MANTPHQHGPSSLNELQARVIDSVDDMSELIVRALSDTVRIPSINPKFPGVNYDDVVGLEGDVTRYLSEIYTAAGAEVDLWEVEAKRTNAAATLRGVGGGGTSRSLIYNGHVDVVPPGQTSRWTSGDPFSGRIDDDRVWGRGASDMKAGLVAQAFAAKALSDAGVRLQGDLIIEAVVGEETMDYKSGVASAIDRGYRADAAVVSEPSGPNALSVSPLSAGMLWCTITVTGKPTHASMRGQSIRAGGGGPEVGVNAIDKGFLVYEAMRRLEEEWAFTKTHPLFAPGHFTIHPGAVIGGPYGAQVPFMLSEYMTIDYVIWYPPHEDPTMIRAEIEAQAQAVAQTDGWLRTHPPFVEWKQNWHANEPGHVADAITDAVGRAHERVAAGSAYSGRPDIAGFCAVSDCTFLTESGIPAISYGPGDLRVAHSDDEYASIEQLIISTKTFALLAMDWCGVA